MADLRSTQIHPEHDNKPALDDTEWLACPTGTLTVLAARQRARIVRRQWSVGVAVAAGCLLLLAPLLVDRGGTELDSVNQRYGGLPCHEVIERMDAFFAANLELPFRQRVLRHLNDCPSCMHQYRRTATELDVDIASMPARVDLMEQTLDAGQPHFAAR